MVKNILIFVGPPASGKGTQGEIVAQKIGYEHFSMGEGVQKYMLENQNIADDIKDDIKSGRLVSNSIIFNIISQKINQSNNNLLFDGFPRSIEQAQYLDQNFPEINKKVICLTLSDESIFKRISGRKICSKCKKVFLPSVSKDLEKCSKCGGEIIKRIDDNEETIKNRINEYKAETEPLIDYYKQKNILIEIDAEPPIEQITENILTELNVNR